VAYKSSIVPERKLSILNDGVLGSKVRNGRCEEGGKSTTKKNGSQHGCTTGAMGVM
jgi:hypothetical protein